MQYLCKKPKTVLIDLNDKEDDPKPVHLSIGDLAQKAIPITGEDTIYYATHLKKEFNSPISCVICTKPGMEIITGVLNENMDNKTSRVE